MNFGSVPKGLTTPIVNGTLFNVGFGYPATRREWYQHPIIGESGRFCDRRADERQAQCRSTAFLCGLNVPPFTFSCAVGHYVSHRQRRGLKPRLSKMTFSNSATAKIDVPLSGTGVVPTITSITPPAFATGGPAFTMFVTGTNYVLGSVVNFNGNPRLTTYSSATQLEASIPATDLVAAGSFAITVTNPGGATSEPKTFIVAAAPTGTNDDFKNAIDASSTPFLTVEDTALFTTNTVAAGGTRGARSSAHLRRRQPGEERLV